jgi:hypothetical protein
MGDTANERPRPVGRKPDFARPTSRPSSMTPPNHRPGPRQSVAAAGLGASRMWLTAKIVPRRF